MYLHIITIINKEEIKEKKEQEFTDISFQLKKLNFKKTKFPFYISKIELMSVLQIKT